MDTHHLQRFYHSQKRSFIATEVRTTVQNNLEPDSQTTNDGDGNGTKVYFGAPVYLYPEQRIRTGD